MAVCPQKMRVFDKPGAESYLSGLPEREKEHEINHLL